MTISWTTFSVGGNYGILDIDRPHVINTSFSYRIPPYYLGANRLVIGSGVNLSTTVSGVISDCGPTGAECAASPVTGGSLDYTTLSTQYLFQATSQAVNVALGVGLGSRAGPGLQ